jgi:hypothetical protein
MKEESISIGTPVRVCEHHRIAERRGMVGSIADHYGQDGCKVVDVRFSDRLRWLLWPEDLEEISSPRPRSAWLSAAGAVGARHCPPDYRTAQTASHSRGKATMPFARSFARTNVWKLGLVSWSSMSRTGPRGRRT